MPSHQVTPKFKIPKIPQPKPLMNAKMIHNLQGRIRAFNSLMDHPRAGLPELQYHIDQLVLMLNGNLECRHFPMTKQNQFELNIVARTMVKIENLLIQVILGGHTLEQALKINKKVYNTETV